MQATLRKILSALKLASPRIIFTLISMVLAGPNFSYSLDGRAMGEDIEPDGSVDIHAEGETDFLFKRFEIGSTVLVGYNFKNGIQLSANYTQGLNNLYRGEEDFKIRSRSFGLSVGYLFGKK